jgi:hypothetical protein
MKKSILSLIITLTGVAFIGFAFAQTSKPQEKKMEEKTTETKSATVELTPELKLAVNQMFKAGIIPGIKPLTVNECLGLGGLVSADSNCDRTGKLCSVRDRNGVHHLQCITE